MSVWETCAPLLDRTLRERHPEWTLDEVRELVERGEALLWPGQRSVLVTDIPRDLRLWLVGGDMGELLSMQPSVEAYARAAGLERLVFEPQRAGWGRVMANAGFERSALMKKGV